MADGHAQTINLSDLTGFPNNQVNASKYNTTGTVTYTTGLGNNLKTYQNGFRFIPLNAQWPIAKNIQSGSDCACCWRFFRRWLSCGPSRRRNCPPTSFSSNPDRICSTWPVRRRHKSFQFRDPDSIAPGGSMCDNSRRTNFDFNWYRLCPAT